MIHFDLTGPLQGVASALESLAGYIYGVAFLLTLVGYYAQVWRRRGEPAKTLEALGLIAVSVLLAASVSFWRPLVTNLFYYPARQLAEASSLFQLHLALNKFLVGINALLADPGGPNDSTIQQVAHFVWNFAEITRAALWGLVIQGFVFLLSIIGAFLALPFYFLQQVLVTVFFAFMPIAICALPVPALRDRAIGYLGMTASVLLWPLGFAIVAAATNIVFQVPFDPGAATPAGVGLVVVPLLRELVAAAIMIFGTLMVPPTMFFLALHGSAQIDPITSAVRSIPALASFARR